MTKEIITYEPDNFKKKGYSKVFGEIYNDLRNNKWLTWQLFKRDFFGAYKQSVMGILWIFILPLGNVIVFILLNNAGIFSFGTIKVPYPLFAFLGTAFWQLFAVGVIAGSAALASAGSMLAQINFSRKSLVLSSMSSTIVSFLILLLFGVVLFFYYHIFEPNKITSGIPAFATILVPFTLIPIVLLALGIAFFFAIFNVVVRDISNALSMIMTILMLLTPVLYSVPTGGFLGFWTKYNPLYYLIDTPRDLILSGTLYHWKRYFVSVCLALGVFVVGIVTFHLSETRVTERI